MTTTQPSLTHSKRPLVIAAWAAMLLISDLPNILWDAVTGSVPAWLFWAKVGFLALFLGVCLAWKTLRPLWKFALIMLVFYLALAGRDALGTLAWWQNLFPSRETSFTVGYLEFHSRDFAVAVIVAAALWLMFRQRQAYFLTRGNLNAPIGRVPWLGIQAGEKWRTFAFIFAGIATLAVAIPTFLGMSLSGEQFARALPLLPMAILLAAVNAITEEIYYRLSMLSTLHQWVGSTQALLISLVFFGLGHYLVGSPPGVVGFLMTGFLAYLLGKSILETKGVFWAWFIHLFPDIVVFFSYALWWVK